MWERRASPVEVLERGRWEVDREEERHPSSSRPTHLIQHFLQEREEQSRVTRAQLSLLAGRAEAARRAGLSTITDAA